MSYGGNGFGGRSGGMMGVGNFLGGGGSGGSGVHRGGINPVVAFERGNAGVNAP
eukprot:CAMPEP_0184683832 /NCGR_PEP_ID=MMETSP0312-20130426/12744_1 /TAXON_ID=31354 /ORGANISM="Compsopogon coeruleus, Strain SAG 36.94" /LENGTH=53 /DNA_ID=CAMNT_0027136469 /DNA_START=85 /DNA_END=242 /DNA_ORIENTATION=+